MTASRALRAQRLLRETVSPGSAERMNDKRLKAAGVSVNIRNYMGVAHEFFGQGAVVPTAKEAVEFAADGLRKTFTP